jgi:hypothetical protein
MGCGFALNQPPAAVNSADDPASPQVVENGRGALGDG